MRTHRDIIRAAGGPAVVHDRLGLSDKLHTVRSWAQRGSIPPDQWQRFSERGLATLGELAAAAKPRKRRDAANDQVEAGRAA